MRSEILEKITKVQPDEIFTKRKNNFNYFINNDISESLLKELTFSVFRYYKCDICCKNCFAIENIRVSDHITIDENQYDIVYDFIKTATHYALIIDTSDDITFITKNKPHLLEFIKHISPLIYYSNNISKIRYLLKDNNIFNFKGIYEISCFTSQINKENYYLIDSLLHEECSKVKIITDEIDAEILSLLEKLYEKHSYKLTISENFIEKNKVNTSEISLSTNISLMCDEFTYCIRYNKNNPTIFRLDDIFSSSNFNLVKCLYLLLQGKIKRYSYSINYAKENNIEHFEEINYMKWVVNNLIVNENYNFIFSEVLNQNNKIQKWFDTNWKNINQHGYVNMNTYNKKIIPLFTIKDDNS